MITCHMQVPLKIIEKFFTQHKFSIIKQSDIQNLKKQFSGPPFQGKNGHI